MSTFGWVLIGAFALYGVGVGLDLWRRPATWERTFAACAITASPAFVIEELALASSSPERCAAVKPSCFGYIYVHSPVVVGAVVFSFLLAGGVTGRSLRGLPMIPGRDDHASRHPDDRP